jgi:hypothetical protein
LEFRARGMIPISLLGTPDFDVRTVDVSSLRLFRADGVGGAVVPTFSMLDDTGTPFLGSLCGCHGLGRDRIMDLSMKFDLPEAVRVLHLETVAPGVSVQLVVSGTLSDGCAFMAGDCTERTPVQGQ